MDSENDPQEQAEKAERWLKVISRQRRREKKWRDQAEKVLDRYRDERPTGYSQVPRFPMLWSNVETLKPAIYARPPVADVRRRYSTQEPAARTAADILQRCLQYIIGTEEFQDAAERTLEDYLLPGRATAMIEYKPIFATKPTRMQVEPLPDDEEGEDSTEEELAKNFEQAPATPRYPPGTQFDAQGAYRMVDEEELVYEEVRPQSQSWKYFLFDPAPSWKRAKWVSFGCTYTKDMLRTEYPDFADIDSLSFNFADEGQDDEGAGKMALIWKLWHKPTRMFMVFAEGYRKGPIFEEQDPLQLEDFFPCPEPLYALRTNGDWLPVPEYLMYKDQANELDEVTARLNFMIEACKNRGVYDQAMDQVAKISDLVKKPDNTFIPVPEFRQLMDKGGLLALISTLPLEQIVLVIAQLRERATELKSNIYEITGISDIVRGQSSASETLGAQQLKAQYNGLRISTRQSRFNRFLRDMLRLQAEVVCEHFSPQTLQLMTGIQVLPDLVWEQMKAAQVVPAGAVSESEFAQACAILKSDKLRGFKVDIEIDSTIPVDRDRDQQNRTLFLQAIAQFMTGALPAVAQGLIPPGVAKEMLLFGVRGFKVGSELEEVLDQLGAAPPPPPQGGPAAVPASPQGPPQAAPAPAPAAQGTSLVVTADAPEMTQRLSQLIEASMQTNQAMVSIAQGLGEILKAQAKPKMVQASAQLPSGRILQLHKVEQPVPDAPGP